VEGAHGFVAPQAPTLSHLGVDERARCAFGRALRSQSPLRGSCYQEGVGSESLLPCSVEPLTGREFGERAPLSDIKGFAFRLPDRAGSQASESVYQRL
jgi:hypothetical protein